MEGTKPYRDATERAAEILQRDGTRGVVFLDAFGFSLEAMTDAHYRSDGLHFGQSGNEMFHGWLADQYRHQLQAGVCAD